MSRKAAPPVLCEIEQIDLEGVYGDVESVRARCTKCDHTTESYGTSDASIRRCLVVMREECPRGESNFYTDIEEE